MLRFLQLVFPLISDFICIGIYISDFCGLITREQLTDCYSLTHAGLLALPQPLFHLCVFCAFLQLVSSLLLFPA